MARDPQPFEKWRYKPNRGSGTFIITHVKGQRVTLQDVLRMRKQKTISVRTLRGDYEPADD